VRHTAETITMHNLEQQITLRFKRTESATQKYTDNRFNQI